MARRQVVLEPVDDAPAVDVGQHDVERHASGVYSRASASAAAPCDGDEALPALLARGVEQEAREGDVVLDDQDHGVAGLDGGAVVARLRWRALGSASPRPQPAPRPAPRGAAARRLAAHLAAAARARCAARAGV